MQQINREGLPSVPIFAIGSIGTIEDIQQLLQAGVYGVTLSGVVTQTPNIISTIHKLLS